MKSKLFYNISRWTLALVFIFSGLAKSINPFGLSIQLGDYLSVMNLGWIKPLAPLGAILLPSLELLLGVMLLAGLSRRLAAWGVMLAMSFFTGLTLWIALYNPVSDCGCFGDILKLTNWETFIKNVILLPMSIVVFRMRNGAKSATNTLYIAAIPLSFALSVYTWFNLPLIDATPFKIGTNLLQAISIPADAAQAEYKTVLIYKNLADNSLHEFSLDDTQWQDTTKWVYVDSQNIVIKEGYVPPIKSLPMLDQNSRDVANEILASGGALTIIVTNDPQEINIESALRLGGRVILLTSINTGLPDRIEHYTSDYSVISTIIQNYAGGALILENGVIVEKKSLRELSILN